MSKGMTKKNPSVNASFLSNIFFCWVSEIFSIGNKRQLEADDLYELNECDQSAVLSRKLETAWTNEQKRAERKGKKPRLWAALIKTFWVQYAKLGLLLVVEESSKIAQPLMIGGLLKNLADIGTVDGAKTRAYLFATGVALCSALLTIVHHPYFFRALRIGMWLRVSCCNLIYKKVLRLDQYAILQTSTGQIVNLMTNDVQRLDFCCLFLHFLWLGPLEAIAVLTILWQYVGVASVAGVAALLVLSPIQVWIGKLFAMLRSKTAKLTDQRVKLTSEMIHGMRVVKMYCWETMFTKLITTIRKQEVYRIGCAYLSNLVKLAQYMTHTKLSVLMILVAGLLRGQFASQINNPMAEKFTVASIFLCLGMFNAVRVVFSIFMPYAVQMGAESIISIGRIQRLLTLPELKNSNQLTNEKKVTSLELKNFCASWNDENKDKKVLTDINLSVTEPELIAVVGPVGSGKSSLVLSILGELPGCSGSLHVSGTIAYAAQQPWVFADSVRENVIFGREWDQQRYEDSINASALRLDFERLPNGDQTVVGERGIALSGGQRARVGLARALYSGADIYVLDDPLSAVDAGVAKHLFNSCIRGYLKDKVRILITHQLQFLKAVDRIVVLQDGQVLATGTYSELVAKGINLDMIIKANQPSEEVGKSHFLSCGDVTSSQSAINSLMPNTRGDHHKRNLAASSCLSIDSLFNSANAIDTLLDNEDGEVDIGKEQEEERASGTLTWRVFYSYFLGGFSILLLVPIFILFAICQGSYVMCDWWLALWMKWERAYQEARNNATGNSTFVIPEAITIPSIGTINSTISFLWILCGLTLAVLVTSVLRSVGFYGFTLYASKRLHNSMLSRLVQAPTRFFDTNSAGRILNRFSKDTGVMDDQLPPALSDFWICSFLVGGNLVVNFIISPWTIVAVTPLVICFVFLRRYYMRTSRNVKRLEAVARSPVFSHVNNTLLGLATVRSSCSEELFARRFEKLQDDHSRSWYIFLVTTRWFGIRLDWLCVFFVISVSYLSIATANVDDAQAGLMLTYAVGMLGMFQWCIRQSTEVENHLVSVERVVEYTKLVQEAPYTSSSPPPKSWPSRGEVEYVDVNFRYFPEGPLVLKSISWKVSSGEKVGIVGRTGAGKSSLVASLFRLAEIHDGAVKIDGMDIGPPMGLHEMRSRISIIPQDPVLFSGTVRWNLDPTELHADESLWHALEDVQMKDAIKDMSQGLDSPIAEGGVNLSVGQRQLMCLARALLRHNRILVIDEATANVDPRTDELIQKTIRNKFAHCTVLTIAHRLHTIMDSDTIMVLDDGAVVEMDHPHTLLKIPNGLFKSMVNQLETREAVALKSVAEAAFKTRKIRGEDSVGENGNVKKEVDVKSEEEEEKTALLNGIHPVV